jgi:hypothetical protein
MSNSSQKITAQQLRAEQEAREKAAAKTHHDELVARQQRAATEQTQARDLFVATVAARWEEWAAEGAKSIGTRFVVVGEVVSDGNEVMALLRDVIAEAKEAGFTMELARMQDPHSRFMPHQQQERLKALASPHEVEDRTSKGFHPGHGRVAKYGRSGSPQSLVVRW